MVILCVLKVYLSYLDVENLAPSSYLQTTTLYGEPWRGWARSMSLLMVAEECLSLYDLPFRVYVADSTGLSAPYKTGVQGPKVKLHTLLPFNVVVAAGITPGSCHDSPVFRNLLEQIWGPGLGDPAFFSEENVKRCLGMGIIPVLKPKEGLKDDFLKRYAQFFNKDGIQVQGRG